MSEEIKLIIGEDGIFREYNDEFDVTIHFENKEEQEQFLKECIKGQKSLKAWDKLTDSLNEELEKNSSFKQAYYKVHMIVNELLKEIEQED